MLAKIFLIIIYSFLIVIQGLTEMEYMQKYLNYTKLFKVLLIIFFVTCLADTFGQVKDSSKDFKTVFKKVNKYYTELSQNDIPGYIMVSMKKADTVNVKLLNNGSEVFSQEFISSDSGTYLIRFFTKEYPEIYGVRINDDFTQLVTLYPEEFIPSSEVKYESYTSSLDTLWKRQYSETVSPVIHYDSNNDDKLSYTYDVTIRFSKNKYTIISERSDQYSTGKRTRVYEGEFIVSGDTLRLLEYNKVKKIFQFKMDKESLELSDFVMIDKNTGYQTIKMDTHPMYGNSGINLRGKYQKSSEK